MKPKIFPPIPMDTEKAARAIFGRSNVYLTTGDRAGYLFDGLILEDLAGRFKKPPRTLALLYLITIFQYIETLPDHLAADALRKRTDWKYALHLPLVYPGLEAGLFCEFRRWLLGDQAGQQDFQTLLQRWFESTDFHSKQPSGPEAVRVITTICQISRLADIWETLNQTMEAVAGLRPEWLLATSLPHWYERYGARRRHLDLRVERLDNDTLAQRIGVDGKYLLEAISESGDRELAALDEVLALGELWREQFECVEGDVMWRRKACVDCFLLGLSPHRGVRTDQGK